MMKGVRMRGEQVRERLHDGGLLYGTHVTVLSNTAAARMLAAAGLDFVFLCGEHMSLDRIEMGALCSLYASLGISPIVRISHPSAVEAVKALDAGAEGIVAPYVETTEQVRELVGAVHYRPMKGRLLEEFLSGARKPTRKTVAFLRRFNRHNYLIIGVESVPAFQNLDELIGVPGVDGVFIGPHDLSVSLEAPEEWNNPELSRTIEEIVVRCRAAGVGVGVHSRADVSNIEQLRHLISRGMNWILDSADVAWAAAVLRERRTLLGAGTSVATGPAEAEVASCIAPVPNPGTRRGRRANNLAESGGGRVRARP